MNGSGDQSLSSNGGTGPQLEIDKSAGNGDVNITSVDIAMRSLTMTTGTLNASSGNLAVGVGETVNITSLSIAAGTTFNQTADTLQIQRADTNTDNITISVAQAVSVNNLEIDIGNSAADLSDLIVSGAGQLTVTGTTSIINGEFESGGLTLQVHLIIGYR